ncbi:glycosyltransferase [Formosa algae]|uniref:Glycosyltransferase involved in cell wall biosynthesis n=1 Tax=Formosa algae TaxID=225843 RepID=A0A9X1CBN3_9FLAO|nr:glycosyltransferase [Formosa algae]MBP1840212.1 glycosyltransferase involved in cell wall biosynthesis [Formosa algae]MDQ0335812.1 glycosyltransferase involved in cell wall biosynthesis [Formosa algae]OEI80974.1 glycosyl transferase family 2 [Formosa algae]
MHLQYSFIIPVYNRPDEIEELLVSFLNLKTTLNFEIVIVEDGSNHSSETVVNTFKDRLNIAYFFKENSGPGDSRNFGMQQATGNYFIILDSDCVLPPGYLNEVDASLISEFVDCFGGPDAAEASFTTLQKAINFSMTSFITTGGIRGHKNQIGKFQPRSFNMGLSNAAFKVSKGFGTIHPGEDPDLSIRLWDLGFNTKLIPEAFVYHKRRISWSKFYTQVNKFGKVRPILNLWHPQTAKLTYWFPTLFIFGFLVAITAFIFHFEWFLMLYILYFIIAFFLSLMQSKSIIVALLSIPAICIQFGGYGYGFFKSFLKIHVFKKEAKQVFPELFF